MDIPCAILIAAFCLPESNLKLEVKAGPEGAVAVVTSGEVRARILLPDESGDPPVEMGTRLCHEGACVDYSARIREDENSADLLIANRGQERFVQLQGPMQAVTELSMQITYLVESRGRWVQIPLNEFLGVVEPPPEEP